MFSTWPFLCGTPAFQNNLTGLKLCCPSVGIFSDRSDSRALSLKWKICELPKTTIKPQSMTHGYNIKCVFSKVIYIFAHWPFIVLLTNNDVQYITHKIKHNSAIRKAGCDV